MVKNIDKKKNEMNTESAITFVLTDVRKSLVRLRLEGNDILALQAITYLFAGNPISLWGDENLIKLCCQIADNVRKNAMMMFEKFGGEGPSAINRMLGTDRIQALACVQALERFDNILSVGNAQIEAINSSNQRHARNLRDQDTHGPGQPDDADDADDADVADNGVDGPEAGVDDVGGDGAVAAAGAAKMLDGDALAARGQAALAAISRAGAAADGPVDVGGADDGGPGSSSLS